MRGKVLTTNAGSLALRFRRRASAIRNELEIAERLNLAEAKRAAVGYSSARAYNPRRTKLRPYSIRKPLPPLPPFLANKQSGRFNQSWKTTVRRTSRGITATLYNVAPYSGVFDGKPHGYMIARPILQEVNKVILGDRRRRMRNAVRKGLSKR
jgi:hypothetical protein